MKILAENGGEKFRYKIIFNAFSFNGKKKVS